MIIAVSESIEVLEKKLETLDGIKSPIKVIDGDCHNQEDDDDDLTMSNNAHSFKRKTNQVDNSEPSAAKKINFSDNSLDDDQVQNNRKSDVEVSEVIQLQDDDISTKISPTIFSVNEKKKSNSDSLEIVDVESGLNNKGSLPSSSEAKTSSSSDIGRPLQTQTSPNQFVTKHDLSAALAEMKSFLTNSQRKKDHKCQASTSKPEEVENMDPDLRAVGLHKIKTTFTSIGIALVVALFEKETLLNSNYKGGKSKIKKPEGKSIHYNALDSTIIEVIKVTVKARFKSSFNEGEFGAAINTKLASLRTENRRHTEKNQGKAE
ncbi:hypothetical protein KQX54_014137 [Cotesia glomerata]|uniref:BEN domain-containing protein n=1 Tax=Cotesia glomerata TaxID=32391 RepID=A0AAV7HJI5_COTGL|nr:hypothetical protein KQX54_014137 [Cotesia glomerata]